MLLMSHEENALVERPRRLTPDREGVPDHEGNSPQRRKL